MDYGPLSSNCVVHEYGIWFDSKIPQFSSICGPYECQKACFCCISPPYRGEHISVRKTRLWQALLAETCLGDRFQRWTHTCVTDLNSELTYTHIPCLQQSCYSLVKHLAHHKHSIHYKHMQATVGYASKRRVETIAFRPYMEMSLTLGVLQNHIISKCDIFYTPLCIKVL